MVFHFLPSRKQSVHVLRPRVHNRVLPDRAVRRRHCVGGGAAQKFLSKIPEKISIYPQNFLMTFVVIENCNKAIK